MTIPNQPIFIEVADGTREYTADIIEGEARRVAAIKAVAARHPSTTFAPPAFQSAVEAEPDRGRRASAAVGDLARRAAARLCRLISRIQRKVPA